MNNTFTKALIEMYHLPGFNTDRSAKIDFVGTEEECEQRKLHCLEVNSVMCEDGYEYEIMDYDAALECVRSTNHTKKVNLAIWRNKVYGEPIPADLVIQEVE